MKYLILGDIHGNLLALEKVKKYFFNKVDAVISHGDVVNYGPWSNECVELLHSENVICLKGNHEDAYIQGYYPSNNNLVKQFFKTTFPKFNNMEIIKSYDVTFEKEDFKVVHTINNKYYYPDTELSNLKINKNLIIGHSHYPFIRKVSGFNFVNTGSVGQNRKNLSLINFVIYDDEKISFELLKLEYNAKLVVNEMVNRSFPSDCINYYKGKI